MRCEHCQESLSARVDGEDLERRDTSEVAAHLSSCPRCQTFASGLDRLHRLSRVREADVVPDLVATIMATAPDMVRPPRLVARGWLREGLVFTGVLLVATALIGVVQATATADHTPAWDLAFGVGLLIAAWQPERGRGLLPMAVVVLVAMSATSLLHLMNGHPAGHDTLVHGLELAGVAFLWALTRLERGSGISPRRLALRR